MNPDRSGVRFVQTARVVERDGDTAAFGALSIGTKSGPSLGGLVCVNGSIHTGLELESVIGGGSRHGAHKADRSCEEGSDGLLGKVHLFKRVSLLVSIPVIFGWGSWLSLPCNEWLWLKIDLWLGW